MSATPSIPPVGVTAIVSALQERPAAHLLLMFDFDGTLVDLAPTPLGAVLSRERRELLARLAARRDLTLAIVSGRRLADVRARVGLAGGLYYAGAHGMEIEGGGAAFLHEGLRQGRSTIAALRERAAEVVAGLAGVAVEDKEYSFVLHTRQAAPPVKADALRAVTAIVSPHETTGAVRVQPGSEMLEVLPNVSWNKGDAVRWIIHRVAASHRSVRAVYAGDDVTDEDALAALPIDGVGVVVGSRPSIAKFRLANPDAVEALLRMLVATPERS
jgi:trehalose-phosphatase